MEKIFKIRDYSFNKKELNNVKLILTYGQKNVENCKYKYNSNFELFYKNLSSSLEVSKSDAYKEFKDIIENDLENLRTIFYSNLVKGEIPVYKKILII